MKRKPQGRFEGTGLGAVLQLRPGVIASNWVFQGMRYMNVYENMLKLALDIVLVLAFLVVFAERVSAAGLIAAFVVAHTLNWIFNGHIFVLMRYVHPVPKTASDFDDYVQALSRRASRAGDYIDGVAIFGSYCRAQLHKFSDLDVRIIVGDGPVAGVAGSLFCLRERFVAFFRVFPLDIYSCVGTACLNRLRDDECPVILLDRSGSLKSRYSARGEITP